MANRVTMTICGQDYTLVADESAAYMEKVGALVDEKMTELMTSAHVSRYDAAVLDVHAEATSEKLALARYFDGRLAAVFGTHTHVQTADEQVLPGGTGYITDLGMCGPADGILGVRTEDVLNRFRTHMPTRFRVATGAPRATGALFEIDAVNNRALSVTRIAF